MPTVVVNHEEIYYAQHGTSGVPLVCLHGAGGSHAAWFNAVKLLDHVSVVALDLPAHGQSTGHGRDSVAAYAEVVSAVLDALHVPGAESHGPEGSGLQARSTAVPGAGSHGPEAVLAGHSMGGAIALWLALHQPARVRGLVLAGTGAKLRVHPDILQAAKEGRPVGSAAVLGGQSYSSGAHPPTAAAEVVYGDWVACDTFNVMDRLGEIHVPTLVLVGAKDMMTPPKYAGFLAQGIKDASLVTIEGAGHSPMMDKPTEVAAVIQAFLDSLQARA